MARSTIVRVILFCAALCVAACSSWFPIAYQSAEALRLDNTIYRDVHVLTSAKIAALPYDVTRYAGLDADITNAEGIYHTIAKSDLSLQQLAILRHELQIFRLRDSAGASSMFFTLAGPRLDSTAATIIDLERSKLTH